MEKAQQLTVEIKYMKYIIVIISAIFFGNVANAQLLRLPANVKKEFGRALRDQLNSPVDSVKQVSFDLIVELKLVNNDSTIVEKVTQLDGDNIVQYLNNTDFVKTCNFYKFMRGRKTIKLHIPFFYSIINRVNEKTLGKNGFQDFFWKMDRLMVRDHFISNECFTEPITIFGAIYE